jgi:hypothetical protein
MKTIRIDFKDKDGVVVAYAVARFQSLPGPGPCEYIGDLSRIRLDSPTALDLWSTVNAASFVQDMIHRASQCGLLASVSSEGAWIVSEY